MNTTLTFDWIQAITWLVAVGLPLLVGLVTTRLTDSSVKVLLLAGLNTLTGLGSEALRTWADGGTFDAGQAVFTILTSLALAWGAYSNVWKPTGIAAAAQRSGRHRAETP